MKKLYFRDDLASVTEHHIGPHSVSGVTFGMAGDDGADDSTEPTWRIVWRPSASGAIEWSFSPMYSGNRMMDSYPEVRDALAGLPSTASIDELCSALEKIGFTNARGHDAVS